MRRTDAGADGQFKHVPEPEGEKRGALPSDAARAPGPSCLDIARRVGLVGVYKDAPSDLSTNPKHMEGFGRD